MVTVLSGRTTDELAVVRALTRSAGDGQARALDDLREAEERQEQAVAEATAAQQAADADASAAQTAKDAADAAVGRQRAALDQQEQALETTRRQSAEADRQAQLLALAEQYAADPTGGGALSGPVGDCPGGDLSGFPNGRLPLTLLCPVFAAPGAYLRADAAYAFDRMSHAYAAAFGTPICVTDAYRSYDDQVRVYAERPGFAAHPGTSNHGWGTAADLCGGIDTFGTPDARVDARQRAAVRVVPPGVGGAVRLPARGVALGLRRLTPHDEPVPVAARALHPYLQVGRPLVLAHRGLHTTATENSMEAFEAAVAVGVTHLETDVHATADGALVVFHDDRLERLTDLTGAVADVTWERLRRARLAGGERVPLLADVAAAWPALRLNVDLKADAAVRPFTDVVRATRSSARVCVASFSDRRRRVAVRALADLGPVAYSLGARGSAAAVALAAAGAPARLLARALSGAVALQLPERAGGVPVVTRRLVRAVHAAGAQVHVWTVDDPARMRALLADGVDGIVTNRADLAVPLAASTRPPGPGGSEGRTA